MATELQIRGRLDAIEAAIAAGVTSVSYEGKTSQFRSLEEMRSIRDELRRQVGEPTRVRRTVARFSNGF